MNRTGQMATRDNPAAVDAAGACWNPDGLILDQPCPQDTGAAVIALWRFAQEQQAEIAQLRAQLAARS